MPLDIYKASAGSGKTFTLTRRYIEYLLAQGQSRAHEHILAVTFTKKATGEMKSRIISELSRLATGEPSDHDSYLRQTLNLTDDQLQQRATKALTDILRHYSRFSVSTIDSFFQQIVRQFAYELGLSGSFNLELNAPYIRQQAVDELFFSLRPDTEDTPDSQLPAWLSRWAISNIEDGSQWNPRRQMLSFASQLDKEQALTLLRDTGSKLHEKNFLEEYRNSLRKIIVEYEDEYTRLQQEAQAIISRHGLSKADFKYNSINDLYNGLTNANVPAGSTLKKAAESAEGCYTKDSPVISTITDCYNDGLGELLQKIVLMRQGQRLSDYTTARLINANLYATGILGDILHFIDLQNQQQDRLPMFYVGQLLQEVIRDTDTPFVYERIGQHLRHFMIDEFQDTSRLQWDNLRPLVQETLANNNSSMVVGDVKQSIYRWRNSDWHLLASEIEKQITDHRFNYLQTNYRSSRHVVNFCNTVFPEMVSDAQKNYNEKFADERFTTTLTDAYSDVEQKWHQQMSGKVTVRALGSNNNFTQEALDLLPSYIEEARSHGARGCDIAILTRSNKDIIKIAQTLIDKGYEVATDEGLLLCSHPAVLFVIDTLRTMLQPDDTTLQMLRHVHYLRAVKGWQESECVQYAIENPPSYANIDQQLLQQHEYDLFSLTSRIIHLYGLDKQADAATYLNTLLDEIYQFCATPPASMTAFLEWWDDNGDSLSIATPQRENAIRIMTIHKSKGLEFAVVIVPICKWLLAESPDKGWYRPQGKPFDELPIACINISQKLSHTAFRADYAEEVFNTYVDSINMLYVALTRAVQRLVVFVPKDKTAKDKPAKGKTAKDKEPAIASNIGTLLWQVLRRKAQNEDLLSEDSYETGDDDWTVVHTSETAAALLPPGKHYNIGNRLRLRSSVDRYSDSDRLRQLNLGTLMHELLSHILTQEYTAQAILDMQTEGRINAESAQTLTCMMQSFFSLVSDYEWFRPVWDRVLCEQDILTGISQPANGVRTQQIYRPDRVMLRGKEAQIIDYKFGLSENDGYKKQVQTYMHLFSQMGYSPRGWLVYAELKKVVEV